MGQCLVLCTCMIPMYNSIHISTYNLQYLYMTSESRCHSWWSPISISPARGAKHWSVVGKEGHISQNSSTKGFCPVSPLYCYGRELHHHLNKGKGWVMDPSCKGMAPNISRTHNSQQLSSSVSLGASGATCVAWQGGYASPDGPTPKVVEVVGCLGWSWHHIWMPDTRG